MLIFICFFVGCITILMLYKIVEIFEQYLHYTAATRRSRKRYQLMKRSSLQKDKKLIWT